MKPISGNTFYTTINTDWCKKGDLLIMTGYKANVQIIKVYRQTKFRVFLSQFFTLRFNQIKVKVL